MDDHYQQPLKRHCPSSPKRVQPLLAPRRVRVCLLTSGQLELTATGCYHAFCRQCEDQSMAGPCPLLDLGSGSSSDDWDSPPPMLYGNIAKEDPDLDEEVPGSVGYQSSPDYFGWNSDPERPVLYQGQPRSPYLRDTLYRQSSEEEDCGMCFRDDQERCPLKKGC